MLQVPSNFVEMLNGSDLTDFHQQVILGLGGCDDSVCTSIPQDLDFLSSDEGAEEDLNIKKSLSYLQSKATSLPQYASCTDLDLTEDEGDGSSSNLLLTIRTLAPKQLTVEAQQNKSIVIAWNPPECPIEKIDSYLVLVDGQAHATLKATESNLRATVQNFDASQIHRISVKTVGTNTKMSNEAACTMVIGKDAPLGPTGKFTECKLSLLYI